MSQRSFELRGVNKAYPTPTGQMRPVLEDITITAEPGEFVAVLGPSGSGKSTLLGILAGTVSADSGVVSAPDPDEISHVFQKALLLPWRTVRQNLEITRRERRRQRKRDYAHPADYYLEAVGLDAYADFYPSAISGGMQQRTSIARALSTEPAMLLMDEPFSALDAMTAIQQRAFLQDLWQRDRKTVVFVTHSVGEAVTLATKVIVVSARPARVLEEIRIDAAFPRHTADPSLAAVQAHILELLGVEEQSRQPAPVGLSHPR